MFSPTGLTVETGSYTTGQKPRSHGEEND